MCELTAATGFVATGAVLCDQVSVLKNRVEKSEAAIESRRIADGGRDISRMIVQTLAGRQLRLKAALRGYSYIQEP